MKRVALMGVALESNSFAPPAVEEDFRNRCFLDGNEILAEAAKPSPGMAAELVSFIHTMNATGPWEPVPVLHYESQPKGPVDQAFFDTCLGEIEARLRDAGPVDGVFIANHGAMTATGSNDPDGDMYARVRSCVGPDVAIVGTLDLHGNISEVMVDAADVLVSYLTNPHVDMAERGEEAALVMRRMFAGLRPKSAFIRLPLTPASINLLTASGPYADLIDYGQRRKREFGGRILNVSIWGGFVYSDTPKNGLAVVVTACADADDARSLCDEIATRAWNDRARFRKSLTPLNKGLDLALANSKDTSKPPVIFSDSGDNPGGGGSGRTITLLESLVGVGAKGVYYGSFFDPELAAEGHALGVGVGFEAAFNRGSKDELAPEYRVRAVVKALTDGKLVGRLGLFAGRTLELGPCCLLEIGGEGGILVVVISNRQQTADPGFFEMFGLDVADARTIAVKSRGHFRAGFIPWFPPERVFEIDTPGLTSPVLENFNWRGLPRPVYPLDEDAAWTPPDR
ncbi:MAG: M81 family metallopeptidase [Rhodospirillales bacterium]|nr:M81 family metallopeptidase [Rhodospirillales bacterium]